MLDWKRLKVCEGDFNKNKKERMVDIALEEFDEAVECWAIAANKIIDHNRKELEKRLWVKEMILKSVTAAEPK